MEKHKSHTKIDIKTREWVIRLHSEGLNPAQIERITGVSKTSVRRILYPTAQWVLNDQQRTKKEPAAAEAGQAKKDILHHTNSITQPSEIVKNFTYFPPILLEFARQYFGEIELQSIESHNITDEKVYIHRSAEVTFTNSKGGKYCMILEEMEAEP